MLCQPIFDGEILPVDEAGGGDQARWVLRAGALGQGAHKGEAGICVGVFIAHAPDDDAGAVDVAFDELVELVLRIGQRGGIGEVDRPIDRNLLPEQQPHFIGDLGGAVVMRVM